MKIELRNAARKPVQSIRKESCAHLERSIHISFIVAYVGNVNMDIKTRESSVFFLMSLFSCCYVVIMSYGQDVHTSNVTS